MSLALVVLGISMVLGCPPSNNSTDDNGGGGPDTTAPLLMGSNPAAGASNFSASSNIVLTYSEAVLVGTGNITITPAGGTAITIAVGDAQVSIASAIVTINPTDDLEVSTSYTLTIPAGAFMDAAENKTVENTVSFMTAAVMAFDTTAPTLVSSNPIEGADDFPAGSTITLTYSEPVLAGTGDITLSYSDGTTITIMIDVTGSQVSIAGAVVSINPTNDLDLSNTHALVIPAGAFMDAAGNTTAENTVSFTTAAALDTTGPMLLSSVPADNATMVEVGANITLTYDEAVQAGTGNISLIISGETTGTEIDVTSAQVTIAGDGNTVVTINPTVDLAVSTTYTLTVAAGAIEDASGNDGIVETFSFSTRAAPDTTAPTVLSSVPAEGGTTVVGANIVLTYSEAVQRGTGDITITLGGSTVATIPVADTIQVSFSVDDTVVTINPTNDLVLNGSYRVSIPAGALQDLSENDAGVFALSFNTPLGSIPSISSTVPRGDAADFENTANIVLTYTEAVQAGSGSITITPDSGSVITIPVSNAQVSIAGNVVTINPTVDLAVSTTYTLTVPAGAFESSDDQTDAGVFTLSFSTAAALDTTAPTVSSSVPAAGGTIQASEDIVLTYSEPVVKGTGSITLQASGGGMVTISVSSALVSVAGTVVTINPMANLQAGVTYVLTVPAGRFEDLADNASVDYTLSFSTQVAGDTTAPTVMSTDPVGGATGVDLDTNIVLTYSETVQAGTGNITITPTGGTAISIAVTDTTQVSIAGAVVTINPTADLVEGNTVYTVSIPAGAITDNADSPNDAGLSTLTFTTVDPTRTVVLWVGGNGQGRLIGFLNDTTGCQGKPSVATGAVTRRFLATGNGTTNQNPVNFTLNEDGGGPLSAYTGATPVFAAHSATTVLTDNDKVANSYSDLISPTTPLLRTFNQAGLNDGNSMEGERSSTENFTFWTGLNNLTGSGYVVGPACIIGDSYWSPASTSFAGVGASNIVVKTPTANSAFTESDVFGRQLGCENTFNVLCITY